MTLLNTNFDDIKNSLKEYVKNNTDFKDYNFEGSVINNLLDILSYNTYQNIYYLNMVSNEMFLDSAQIRNSVISKAKMLGYVPKSRKSASAKLQITIYPGDNANQIVSPKYSHFISTIDNVVYDFYTLDDVILEPDNSGNFITELTIYEGTPIEYNFQYTANKFYEIADPNIDTKILRVFVRPDINTDVKEEYFLAETLADVTATSKVFYIQMNLNGKYEIYFGDNVLGAAPNVGNYITLETISTRGKSANDINTFSPKDYIAHKLGDNTNHYGNIIMKVLSPSSNGEDAEDISSIKFSAPKKYSIQNRVVTEKDYKNWLLSSYTDIESISVWGGDKNVPPLFGKVILAIKPKNGYMLSNTRKAEIISALKNKNILSFDPIIVDPLITHIKIDSDIKYYTSKTSMTSGELMSEIVTKYNDYENNYLGKFESGYFSTNISEDIKNISNESIKEITLETKLEKRLTPIIGSNMSYKMTLNCAFYSPYSGYLGCLNSSGFYAEQFDNNLIYLDDDGKGNIRVYTYNKSDKIYLSEKIGTIDYSNGIIQINSLKITDIENQNENYIRIVVKPDDSYYVPSKNEVLLLSEPTIKIYDLDSKKYLKSATINTLGNNAILYSNYIAESVI